MVTSGEGQGQEWGVLADLEAEERATKMLQILTELAALPEEELQSQMLEIANAEAGLSDDKLRDLTRSRLRVWLQMESEAAQHIATSYDVAMRQMSGAQAMRRVSLVQTLCRELSAAERAQLATLETHISSEQIAGIVSTGTQQASMRGEPVTAGKKGWWPFRKQ